MGYSSNSSKNSVSGYSTSSKNSSYGSKDSVSNYAAPRTTALGKTSRRLTAAKGIKDILSLIESLEQLTAEKERIEAEIVKVESNINKSMGEVKDDPTFERIKQYLLKK
jgi:hypothetical protein